MENHTQGHSPLEAILKGSKHLLDTAKRAVEIAIEEDEDAACRFIETKAN